MEGMKKSKKLQHNTGMCWTERGYKRKKITSYRYNNVGDTEVPKVKT